jgi:hypothetical protein
LQSSAHDLQSSTPTREDQVSRNPILESFILLGFLLVLVSLGLNPTIFTVSRVFLDSINRLINTEKHTRDFVEEFSALKEAIFRVYSFPFLFYFMKMFSIKLMCN